MTSALRQFYPQSSGQSGGLAVGVIGAISALIAVSFVLFHWTLAMCAAAGIVVLAAMASEWFIIALIFLTPVGYAFGGAASIVPGLPSFSSVDGVQAARLLAVVGFFGAILWSGSVRLRRVLRVPLARASLVFAGAVLLSSFLGTTGMRLASAARAGTHVVGYVCFFLLIVLWLNSRSRFEAVARALLLSLVAAAGFGMIQTVAGGYTSLWHFLYAASLGVSPWSGRSSSFFAQVNEFALYSCLLLPFSLGCFLICEGRWRRLGGWAFSLGVAGLLTSQSRGGLVALGAVLLLASLVLGKDGKRRVLALGLGAVVALGIYGVVRVSGLSHVESLPGMTVAGRFFLWQVAWQFFTASPLVGIGWGNFQALHTTYFASTSLNSREFGVENLYLQLLAETGLIGFSAFCALVFDAASLARRRLRSFEEDCLGRAVAFGVLGALVVLLVQGFVEAQLEVSQIGTVLWLLFALLVAAGRPGVLVHVSADSNASSCTVEMNDGPQK